jgi:hypothetical protein
MGNSGSGRSAFTRFTNVLPLAAFALAVGLVGAYFGEQVLGQLLFGVPLWGEESAQVYPPGSPAALIEEHDCWTDEAPEGVIPGHVVVSVAGDPQYAGQQMTERALEQVFEGVDHGLVVHAFCR